MNKKLILWILVLIVISQLVLGLGVRPAKTTFNTNDALSFTDSFMVVNNDGYEMKLKVYLEGDLAQYVELDKDEITIADYEEYEEMGIVANFVKEDIPPGNNIVEIIVEEVPYEDDQSMVSSRLILKHKIIIVGEYPDKYVSAKLGFMEDDDNIVLVTEVENLGKEDIDEIKTTYYVNDRKQLIETLETELENLAQGDNSLLTSSLSKNDVDYGEFDVVAMVEYDGEEIELNNKMTYGDPEIEITYFEEYFITGIINPYTLELLNNWNQKIENVFVEVAVKKENEDGSLTEVDGFRTRSVDINDLERETIEDYYDATERNRGDYIFSMIVNYWNSYKMDQQEFEVRLITEEEEQEYLESLLKDLNAINDEPEETLTGAATTLVDEPVEKNKLSLSAVIVIIIMLWVLILTVVVVVILVRVGNKKEDDGWEEY